MKTFIQSKKGTVLIFLLAFVVAFAVTFMVISKKAQPKVCTDPQKLDQKSNDWRSVFLWLNIAMSLRKKLSMHT